MLWVFDIKDVAYLLLSCSCCCRCQSNDPSLISELLLDHVVQHQVGRPEIVRPFTGAVDLIDADHGDLAAELAEVLHEEPLWCDEEHLDLLLLHGLDDILLRAELLLRVEGGTGDEIG